MCTASAELGSPERPRPTAQATLSDYVPSASPPKRLSADYSDPLSDTSEVTPVSGDDRVSAPAPAGPPAPVLSAAMGAGGAPDAATSVAAVDDGRGDAGGSGCNGFAVANGGADAFSIDDTSDDGVWALGVEPLQQAPPEAVGQKNPMQLPPALDRIGTLQAALDAGRRRPVFFLDYGASFLWKGEESGVGVGGGTRFRSTSHGGFRCRV